MPVVQYPTNLQEAFTGISVPAFMAARQQLQDAQANEALNQKKAQQDYDLQQQKTPYELEKLGLENQQIGLTNTGLGYTNRQQAVKAATDEALQQSNIQKGLSANQTAMDIDKVKQLGAMADHASKIADAIDSGVPLLSVADRLPPDIAQVLAQPGGTQRLRQWAAQVAAHSQEQLQTMQKVNAENASAERRTTSTNKTNWDIANLKSSTMLQVSANKAQKAVDLKKFDQASLYFDLLADQMVEAGNQEQANALRERATYYANLAKQAPTDPNKLNVPEVAKLPSNPKPATGAPEVKGTGTQPAQVQLPGGITVKVKQTKG